VSRLAAPLRIFALLAVSTAASLALGECALRAFRPEPLGFHWLSAEGLPVHVPNLVSEYRREEFRAAVRINSLGFRDGEFAIPKPPGTFRILALGDSFTEGLQVHDGETFTARMTTALSTPQRPVEVLNLGVSGYGTADALALLRVYGPRLEPDLVLLFVCLANDVANNVASPLCHREGDRLVCGLPEPPDPRRLAISHLRSRLAASSQLYQLLRLATAHPFFARIGLRAELEQTPPERPFGRDQYREPPPAYVRDGFDLTRDMLGELRDAAKELGAETWVVLVPVREQIWDREWNAILASDARPETLVRDALQRALGDRARELGLVVVDLYDAFRTHNGAGETLYWRIDAHYDAAGHALTADEVVAALRARGLPPP
jgi:lysophospholipase L1-like esterase